MKSMLTLLERPIKINRIVTTSTADARAIEDPMRAKVVGMLYKQSMSADQITQNLKKVGFNKALTTVRHHLEVLKESGLIKITRIDERRGAVTKYYSTSTRLMGYELPEDFEAKYSKVISRTSARIEKILKGLETQTGPADKKESDEYSQYLMVEIMNRAVTSVLEHSKD